MQFYYGNIIEEMKWWLYFFACLAIFTACDTLLIDEDEFFIDQQLKEYCDFPRETYWIYHNDSLNVYDTLKVVGSCNCMFCEHHDSWCNNLEHLGLSISRSYCNSIIYESIYSSDYGTHCYYGREEVSSTFSKDLFQLVFSGGEFTSSLYGHDSISYISNDSISDVFCIRSYSDEIQPPAYIVSSYYYLAKGFGVIEYSENINGMNLKWRLAKTNSQLIRINLMRKFNRSNLIHSSCD
jgi:hypothetical protein